MRIVAGEFKGKRLKFPQSTKIRPTADMVKESIFAKLFDKVQGAVFLDAFCGSGQIGIEALSRGASKVFFIDWNVLAIKTLQENLKNLNVDDSVKIIRDDVLKALNKIKQKFDIIFLDPPYDYKKYDVVFETIKQENLLNEDGIIVCEHFKDLDLNFEGFTKESVKNYGIKKVSYFKQSKIKA